MKRIVIFGSDGKLGSLIASVLAGMHLVKVCNRKSCDILDSNQVLDIIKNFQPDLVINAAAFTDVTLAESHFYRAMEVNHFAVGNIAKICYNFNATLLHFSTDYVFDGANRSAYVETDQVNPINSYGFSKVCGEAAITENLESFYILRLQWLIGSTGNTFISKILETAKHTHRIDVVCDQTGTPTSYGFVAGAVKKFVDAYGSDQEAPFGIYHVSPDGWINRFEFAKQVIERFCNFKIHDLNCNVEVFPVLTATLNEKFSRPSWSVFCCDKFFSVFPCCQESWRVGFESILDDWELSFKNSTKQSG